MYYWEVRVIDMGNKFNLSKYNADKGKSYKFCQERKTIEDETNTELQQEKKIVSNLINRVHGGIDMDLLKKSEKCKELDILDCCGLSPFIRTKPECSVCIGNI